MSLSSSLESKFRGDIRYRGQAYVKAERVAITRVTADELFGVVEDGTEFQTQLTRRDDALLMTCSCANGHGNPHEVRCKHVWATILQAEQTGYINDASKPNYFPPFTTEEEPLEWEYDEDDWDEVPSGDAVRQPSLNRRKMKPAAAVVEPMDAGEAAPSAELRETEIFYEIDVKQSQLEKQLVIGLVQRQRRNNGSWGKLKPLRVRANRFEDVTLEEDRHILATLLGGVAERSNWYAQQSELQAAANRFQVPFDLAELLMPEICATGRLRFQEDDEDQLSSRAIVWDTEPSWEMAVSVVFDEANQLIHAPLDGGAEGFRGDAGFGVLFENRVQNRIRNLVGYFVGMSFGHRLGGKKKIVRHGCSPKKCEVDMRCQSRELANALADLTRRTRHNWPARPVDHVVALQVARLTRRPFHSSKALCHF